MADHEKIHDQGDETRANLYAIPVEPLGAGAPPNTETPHRERPIHIGSTQPAVPGTPIFTGGNTGATINIEPEQ
ncbi:MAG: hypothetical protein HGB34_02805 [Candidatus Moranbacteria bacterium]|nr:hypothetical protein [Candidatus Moranbacteria bacterium]NTW75808.1 hypothetical protein [Candidatus Moranbacteria bacterium]